MKAKGKEAIGRVSVVIGLALIVAAIGDYAGHLWGHSSPHPWWVPLIVLALGFLLLFPDRLGLGVDYATRLLPWFSDRDNPDA